MSKWISIGICKGRKVTIVNLPKGKVLRWVGKILARILKK
jgi:hypothetical protein